MRKQQQSFEVKKARIWIVKGIEFTSKNAAYRHSRTVNGKKSGGHRPYNVERKNA